MRRSIPTETEIRAMTSTQYKSLETRLRRVAQRRALRLDKSRSRDPRATDYGTYQLVDMRTNALVSSGLDRGYGLSLADVAERLLETPIGELADELRRRGFGVELGKSFGGEHCIILHDADENPIGVTVIDFGRDPLGRKVDVRWESQGYAHMCSEEIGAAALARRILATL
jgi:hypothetical protein